MARMQNSPSVPRTDDFEPEEKPIFRLVLIYEDMASGKRAMRTCQALIDKIGEEFEFRNSLWSFDVLQLSKTQSEAAQEAATADMIMIAAHGTEPLPDFVSTWIENWAWHERTRRGALVALIETGEHFARGTSPAHAFLRTIAENAQLDFFFQETSSLPDSSFIPNESLHDRAKQTSSILEGIVQRPIETMNGVGGESLRRSPPTLRAGNCAPPPDWRSWKNY